MTKSYDKDSRTGLFTGCIFSDIRQSKPEDSTKWAEFLLAGQESYRTPEGKDLLLPFFLNIRMMGKQAESFLSSDPKAGTPMAVRGKITYREWEDKEGKKQRKTFISPDSVYQLHMIPKERVLKTEKGYILANATNQVQITGWIPAAPELRYTGKGQAVCDLRFAMQVTNKNDQGGYDKDTSHWAKITLWGDQAEQVAMAVDKHSMLMMTARVSESSRKDEKTGKVYHEFKIEPRSEIFFLARPGQSGNLENARNEAYQSGGGGSYTPSYSPPAGWDGDESLDNFPPEEEDLPF